MLPLILSNNKLLSTVPTIHPVVLFATVNIHIYLYEYTYMGSCQNYGPFLGTLNNRCHIIIGTPKGDNNFDNHPYIYIYTHNIC